MNVFLLFNYYSIHIVYVRNALEFTSEVVLECLAKLCEDDDVIGYN